MTSLKKWPFKRDKYDNLIPFIFTHFRVPIKECFEGIVCLWRLSGLLWVSRILEQAGTFLWQSSLCLKISAYLSEMRMLVDYRGAGLGRFHCTHTHTHTCVSVVHAEGIQQT